MDKLLYDSTNDTPTSVCYTHLVEEGKHYVRYGAVKGSKRVRHQLDLPYNVKVYNDTLRHLATQRHNEEPIISEFTILQDNTIVNKVTEQDICNTLSSVDNQNKAFWEHNIELFGMYDTINKNLNIIPIIPISKYSTHLIEYMQKEICNKNVLQQKIYKTRSIEKSDEESTNELEHFFAVSYRFRFNPMHDVIVYGYHIVKGEQTLSINKIEDAWKIAQKNVRNSPQYWWCVPFDIYFSQLCENDGWQ